MIRKICTTVAAVAAVLMATAGVANASTPVAKTDLSCTIGGITHILDGVTSCPTSFAGANIDGRGGRFGHGFGGGLRGGFFRGGYYRNGLGNVLSYDQVVSSCGCGGSTLIPTGYTLVPNYDPQVEVVPGGPILAGDGSCATLLPGEAFGRFGGFYGGGFGRGWHRH